MDIKNKIYWCDNCKIPIIIYDDNFFHKCELCGDWTKYLSTDIRPVFPEERLFFELVLRTPNKFKNKSVWCNNSTYFVDGKTYKISGEMWSNIDAVFIQKELEKYKGDNTYCYFNMYIDKFILANKKYFNYMKFEACEFIKDIIGKYPKTFKYISFSGGKDSTVVADLVVKSIGNPSIMHVFCDTALEYPFTFDYIKKFKQNNPKSIFKTICNKEHNFYKLCDDIGVPSVSKRWCCTIFKSGITSKFLNQFFIGQKVLTFSGLRSSESKIRKNYTRVIDKNEKKKIQNQVMISPILNWKDIDVWLYILSENILFNESYKLGFSRVGCWCCPNTTYRGDTLAKIYMPNQASGWYKFLVGYATKIGKENPKNYINLGKWKLNKGGRGLPSSVDVKINKSTCTTDEYSKIYTLNKPINEDFYMLFIPFGEVSKELGRKVLDEILILNKKNTYYFYMPYGTNFCKNQNYEH